MNNTATTTRPLVLADDAKVARDTRYERTRISHRSLKSGMVIVGDNGTGCLVLDHYTGNEAGMTKWLALDLVGGGYVTVPFIGQVPVATKSR